MVKIWIVDSDFFGPMGVFDDQQQAYEFAITCGIEDEFGDTYTIREKELDIDEDL